MLPGMRNPIHPSPDRPIPLPDCILMDSWWTDRQLELRAGTPSALRVIASERDEAADDRSRARSIRND